MNRSRVAKLERHARKHPCPECGRVERSSTTGADPFVRLSPEERAELRGILRYGVTPPCTRCGRVGHDPKLLTDDQKGRVAWLFRKSLFGEGRSRVDMCPGSALTEELSHR
ncbi:hypothetical protein J8F10_05790 [Gemmata sp. G18]|uniref:YgiT-type zinc finger protein n=1 Tax=Gemmata palustris TaxID=2822762 RepID=A0ABS5BMV4_9BACT|nr:hypothetical protein [Gemmata palustris]MBP3954792.1 hypothetical protein [Gemmata palustris]